MKFSFFFLIAFFTVIHAIEKRVSPLVLTTSVIIPCPASCSGYLPNLLDSYAKQSVIPDQVVVSISNATQVDQKALLAILKANYPFDLQMIRFKAGLSEGENRNHACCQTSGDLIIVQDSCDLPHPQRVEILKFYFENYPIDYILHTYVMHIAQAKSFYDPESINCDWKGDYLPSFWKKNDYAVTSSAFTRKVFQTIQWDVHFGKTSLTDFNQEVYKKFKGSLLTLEAPLYICNPL